MSKPFYRHLLLSMGALLPLTAEALAAELFVADRASNRILSFDEESGDFLRVVTSTGLDGPSGLTFGPDGFLYVSNVQGGPFPGMAASVVKVDPVTGATTPFITSVLAPGGIVYHEGSNSLFVSEFAEMGISDGNEVYRFDASGTLMQTIGTGSPNTGRAGMTFDGGGNLYVSEMNLTGAFSRVLKYDAPVGDPGDDYASTATTFASGEDVTLAITAPPSGFNGLAFDDHGSLYVASLVGQSLIKFYVSGGAVVEGVPFGAPLPYPSGIMVEADGNILVTSLGNNNPMDPFYPNLFPGTIARFHADTFGTSQFLVGDVNRDTVVDGADLAAWQASYGTPYNVMMNADLDGDFDTDGRDFLLWQRGYNNSGVAGDFQPTGVVRYEPALANVLSVPEPSGLIMLGIVGSFAVFRIAAVR